MVPLFYPEGGNKMLFQRTIGDICATSKSCEEVRSKLKEKHIPFEEYGREK